MTIKEVSEKYGISQDTLRYYERVGMIPEVTRTKGGMRDYQEKDLGWVELSKCMRSAGLPVEAQVEYVKLCQVGPETVPARLALLMKQREKVNQQMSQLEATKARLDYKIAMYEKADGTGKEPIWEPDKCEKNKVPIWNGQEGRQELESDRT